jgi:hypothetical protein
MANFSTDHGIVIFSDWTAVTKDGKKSAQFEETMM